MSCSAGWISQKVNHKKAPVAACGNQRGRPTRHGDDKPGLPAQGEERGASLTLIKLDGDGPRKFQSFLIAFFGVSFRRW